MGYCATHCLSGKKKLMWPFQTTGKNLVFAEFDPRGRLYNVLFRITTDVKIRDSFGCSDGGVQGPERRVQGKTAGSP